MRLTTLIFLLVLLAGCSSNRNFDTPDQFKKWVEGKTFTSTGNDLDQLDSHGNYHSPIGTLELKFNGEKMSYQNGSPQSYTIYKDGDDWIAEFKRLDENDSFELVVPPSGEMYVRSLDYDLSHMEEGSSSNVYQKLDAITSKKVTRGPTMEITDEHDVIPLTKEQLDSAKKANTAVMVDTSKMKVDTGKVNDDVQKTKNIETQPIGNDTTSLIVQTNTEYKISDKLPLSYQYGNMIFTFSKADDENTVKLDCNNETGLTGTYNCVHQGVYLYVNGGMQDIFTCGAGKVKWHNGNTNVDVQLYQVKIK